jgi:hypothetical protein
MIQQTDSWAAWMRRPSASDYLLRVHGIQMGIGTLAKLACVGGGPLFSYRGRFPVYSPESLDEWAAKRSTRSVRSTSEGKRLRAELQQAVAA